MLLDLAYLSHKSDEACRTASYSNSEGDHGVNEDGVVQLRYILPLFWSDISQRCAGGLETLEEHANRKWRTLPVLYSFSFESRVYLPLCRAMSACIYLPGVSSAL